LKTVGHSFDCLTCEPHVLLETPEAAKSHLKSVHGVDRLNGTRRKLGHIDFSWGWSTTYELQLAGGLRLAECYTEVRRKAKRR